MSGFAAFGNFASSLFGSTLGAMSAEADRRLNEKIAKQNLELQQKNLDWQKSVQQKTWEREDTAVQRKYNDLLSAGLNPYSANTGNGANSGAIVSTQAPQYDYKSNIAGSMAPFVNLMNSGVGQMIDTFKAVQEAKKNALETQYLDLINKGQIQKNIFEQMKNIDFGNQLYHDWSYNNGSSWVLPDVYTFGMDSENTKKWQEGSYKWQNRNYNLDINDLNRQLYQADVLQSNTRADFEYSNQLEGLIVDALRTLISGYGAYNNRGRRR